MINMKLVGFVAVIVGGTSSIILGVNGNEVGMGIGIVICIAGVLAIES